MKNLYFQRKNNGYKLFSNITFNLIYAKIKA